MAKFEMKTRPKKPTQPSHESFELGNYVSMAYMLECIEKFKNENPDHTPSDMMVEAYDDDYDGPRMLLTSPPPSQKEYEAKHQAYKLALKTYQMWQKANKPQIDKHKAAEKKATAKRKLLRRMESLTKELEGVEGKLAKT